MILEELTFKRFGYYPSELPPKSGKKILVACDQCGKVRINRKGLYRPLCRVCSRANGQGFGHTLNRMYRFEDLYSSFLSDSTTPWQVVVDEIHKKARRANPYALNIWRFFGKDFTLTKAVRTAIDFYFDSVLKKKNLGVEKKKPCSQNQK